MVLRFGCAVRHCYLMNESSQSPLLSFVLIAYNQERYIRKAVEGAFAQAYSPLEIILTDDHSTDRTFEIIKELVHEYRGPHRVILNRNECNCGIGRHVNKVFSIANGELIILAAGDDISLPERCEVMATEWVSRGRPSGMASKVVIIDEDGFTIGSSSGCDPLEPGFVNSAPKGALLNAYAPKKFWTLLGCSTAYTSEVWKYFGPLPEDLVNEDTLLTLRCCLLKGVRVVSKPLVRYRKHESNIWEPRTAKNYSDMLHLVAADRRAIWQAQAQLTCITGMCKDADCARSKQLISESDHKHLRDVFHLYHQTAITVSEWWTYPFLKKVGRLRALPDKIGVKLAKLLPQKQYFWLRAFIVALKRMLRFSPRK